MRILVFTGRYPSSGSPYNHMFVHQRSLAYLRLGHSVQVRVPTRSSSIETYEGVDVVKGPVRDLVRGIQSFDAVCIHLILHRIAPELDGDVIFDALCDEGVSTLFFIHGIDVQTLAFGRPFDIRWRDPKSLARWIYRDLYQIVRMRRAIRKLLDRNLNLCFVTPSHWMLQEAESSLGFSLRDRAHVIPNGIRLESFPYACRWHNRHKVVAIRPLYSAGKYANDLLVDAARASSQDTHWTLYGDGPDHAEIEHRIRRAGLGQRMTISKGFIEHGEIASIHSRYGLFAGATRFDSQGISSCEAMASGLPVISHRTCAVPEFIRHGTTGMLADSGDARSFAGYVNELLEDQALYERLSTGGRESAERLDINKTCAREIALMGNGSAICGPQEGGN